MPIKSIEFKNGNKFVVGSVSEYEVGKFGIIKSITTYPSVIVEYRKCDSEGIIFRRLDMDGEG